MKFNWKKAFLIGIIGSFIFKVLEIIGQSLSFNQFPYMQMGIYGTNVGSIILSQLLFLIIVSAMWVFILGKTFKKLWIISFIPFLYYLTKEAYNMIVVAHVFYWANPLLESIFSLVSIPVGLGIYYLVRRFK